MLIVEIILGILGLSLVVLVHEGGHYIAARLTGIRVETFSVGFGNRLAGFRKDGTDYRISLIPLGGYCRFQGETAFKKALTDKLDSIPSEPGDFYAAPPLHRIFVAVSGPLANLLFAFIVFMLVSFIGFREHYTEPRILLQSAWMDTESPRPADHAGLEDGDLITAVNGKPIDRFSDLRLNVIFRPEEPVELTILRSGRGQTLHVVPEFDKETGTALIGIINWIDPVLDTATGPAADVLLPGDRIILANGTDTPHTAALFQILEEHSESPVSLKIDRQGQILSADFDSPADLAGHLSFRMLSRRFRQNLPRSVVYGISETASTLNATVKGLRMLFLGAELKNTVSGPVRLITSTGAMVARGFRSGIGPGFLWTFELMALISISLAFLNLLPIPVLDGGQILLFLTELIMRKQIRPKAIYIYQATGTIIVLFIAIAATAGDIISIR